VILIPSTLCFQAAELAAGLEQSGNGLVYPITATAWKLSSGPKDERLADQVKHILSFPLDCSFNLPLYRDERCGVVHV
jgi:hypothetical protein